MGILTAKWERVFAAYLLVWILFLPLCVQATQDEIPESHLIKGVPYISWNEASQMEYPSKNIQNPSAVATDSMIYRYWGLDPKRVYENALKGIEIAELEALHNSDGTLDELKSYIVQGIPIVLAPAPLTTITHPLYSTFKMMSVGTELAVKPKSHCSWMSGDVLESFDWINEFWETLGKKKFGPLQESIYFSGRVLIGYDDERQVVQMHDPTYGPAWEVDYETFEDMWAVANHSYHVIHPKNYLEVLSKKNTEKEYRGRSPNERAAFQLLHGCSLSSMSRYPEAEEQLEKGALIPDISKGYQHLLLFELARHQAARGAIDDAIESTKLAIKKLPKNYYPWEYLVVLYKSGGYAEGEQKAAEKAEKKAHKLREKSSAARVVARTIPSDYYIPGLSGLRGWGLASPKSSH